MKQDTVFPASTEWRIQHYHTQTDRQTEWLPGLPVEAKNYLNLFSLFLLTNVAIIEGAGLNWCWQSWLRSDISWCHDKGPGNDKIHSENDTYCPHQGRRSVPSSQWEARDVRPVTNERPASWHLIVSVTQYSVSFVTFVSWGADNMYDAADVRNQKCVYHSQHILENGWPRVSLLL